jgi:hypothetical protein
MALADESRGREDGQAPRPSPPMVMPGMQSLQATGTPGHDGQTLALGIRITVPSGSDLWRHALGIMEGTQQTLGLT